MKILITTGMILSFLFWGISLSAQEAVCGTDEKVAESLSENPALAVDFEALYDWLNSNPLPSGNEETVRVIPTVVHVMHTYGVQNISDAQIADAIRILNEDFQKQNADIGDVVPAFQSITGNTNFEFRLAQRDPNGNCTNGIIRSFTALTNNAGDRVKAVSTWPRNRYFNVWVVNNIASGSGTQGIIAGYAYLPGSAPSASVDGIILDHRYTGSIGASQGTNFAARVITHEAGHWFGLLHPWGTSSCGQNCNGDDFIGDTPQTSGACNNCNLNQTTCGNLDNVQNFMDYALCSRMFTAEQSSRMIQVVTSSTAGRNNLWTSSNRTSTGTNDGFSQTCRPIADFWSNTQSACIGSVIQFRDHSWNATPTSWNWTISNGSANLTSTLQNPQFTFNEAGTYQVTLTVANAQGTSTETRQKMITIFPVGNTFSNWIYEDRFENGPISTGRWTVPYAQNGANGWQETTAASFSSPGALRVRAFDAPRGEVFNLISPSYDFSAINGNIQAYWKYSYARRNNTSNDQLRIYISTNCGVSWSLRKAVSGADLATVGNVAGVFTPTSAAQWKTDSLGNFQALANNQAVRFRFEFTSDLGNDFYLDDFMVMGPLSIEDALEPEHLGIRLFPNPTADKFQLTLNLTEPALVNVTMTDIAGRQVLNPVVLQANQGANSFGITPPSLSSGMYMVYININGRTFTQKLQIQ
jgi:PKD repeat protein